MSLSDYSSLQTIINELKTAREESKKFNELTNEIETERVNLETRYKALTDDFENLMTHRQVLKETVANMSEKIKMGLSDYSSLYSFFKDLEKAEEQSKQMIEQSDAIDKERLDIKDKVNYLTENAKNLNMQQDLLNEKTIKLTSDVDNFDKALEQYKQEHQSREINYFIAEDGYCYVDSFKREWIEDHVDNQSGPLHCANCEAFGTIIQDGRIIFLGYCLNCASHIYDYTRGSGFQGFDNTTDMETIKKGDVEHLETYREQIIAYITNRLKDTNFELQFPEDVQPSEMSSSFLVSTSKPETTVPTTTVPVSHFDGVDCNCDYCESDNDDLSQQDSDPHTDSTDDYAILCDCCHPNKSCN